MEKNLKIIIIHGNGGGSATDLWFPYVKNELEKLKLTVIAENFPDPIKARETYWLPFLKDHLEADKNTILIGYSSGAEAAMRFAEKNSLYGSILIGPCYTDLGEESERVSGYYNRPWDWKAIRSNQNWIVQFSSQDDPFIPIEEGNFIHEKLGTEYYEFQDQGHFGFPNNDKVDFPEIVDVIKKKLSIK